MKSCNSIKYSSTDLHEVVCDVFWFQARNSLVASHRYIDSEVSGLQPSEVCEQMSSVLVQRWGGTRQHLDRETTGKNCGFKERNMTNIAERGVKVSLVREGN